MFYTKDTGKQLAQQKGVGYEATLENRGYC